MYIKNIFQLLFITAVSITNISAMEAPKNSFLDKKKIYTAFLQTPQYQNYDRAKKLHEKYNTPQTEALLEEAAAHLLETQESEELLSAAVYLDTTVYSDNTIIKNTIMKKTSEYRQYEEAKIAHQKYNTADTLYIMELCKEELHNSKECLDLLHAMEQDEITQSHKKQNTHTNHYNSLPSSAKQQSKCDAWNLVTQTREYQLFQYAERQYKIHKTPETKALIEECYYNAKRTPEYQCYAYIAVRPPTGPIIITGGCTQAVKRNICLNYLNEQNNPDQKPIEIILKDKR